MKHQKAYVIMWYQRKYGMSSESWQLAWRRLAGSYPRKYLKISKHMKMAKNNEKHQHNEKIIINSAYNGNGNVIIKQ